MAPPFKESEFDIIYGKGISKSGDLLDLGVKHEIINKSGTWFSYEDQRMGQGRENSKNFLETNAEIYSEIEQKLRVKLNLNPTQSQKTQPTESKAKAGK